MKMLAMLCLLAVAVPAMGTDWYLFNFAHLSCESAPQAVQKSGDPAYSSPYAMREEARKFPDYVGTRIYRIQTGQIQVSIEDMPGKYINFFSSSGLCHAYERYVKSQPHHISNLNDLR